jgi:hypothetical protein
VFDVKCAEVEKRYFIFNFSRYNFNALFIGRTEAAVEVAKSEVIFPSAFESDNVLAIRIKKFIFMIQQLRQKAKYLN